MLLVSCCERPLIDSLFFVLMIAIFINEGHYVLSFLWVYMQIKDNALDPKRVCSRDTERDKIRKGLVTRMRNLAGGSCLPAILHCDKFDPDLAYHALLVCDAVYGRQPFSGYRQGSGRPCDDDNDILDPGAGGRIHRFCVRMQKIAEVLRDNHVVINNSPVYANQMIQPLLQTTSPWKPYQAQTTMRRYLCTKYYNNMAKMTFPRLHSIELPGPGTFLYFRRMCPEGFALKARLEGMEATRECEGTVENASTVSDKTFAHVIIELLSIRQDQMVLHTRVNELTGQKRFGFDEFQNSICEIRGFVYTGKPRKDPGGFIHDLRAPQKMACDLRSAGVLEDHFGNEGCTARKTREARSPVLIVAPVTMVGFCSMRMCMLLAGEDPQKGSQRHRRTDRGLQRRSCSDMKQIYIYIYILIRLTKTNS